MATAGRLTLPDAPVTTRNALGQMTRAQLYGPAMTRLLQGAHVRTGHAIDHGLLVLAVRSLAGDEPVLLGLSAAWAHGVRLAGAGEPVRLGYRPGLSRPRRQALLRPHRLTATSDETVRTSLGLATTPERTAVDLARGLDRGREQPSVEARVVAVDALLRATRLPAAEARAALRRRPVLARHDQAAVVLALCRDGVDSPRETVVRLLLHAGGLPEPVVQCPVLDSDGRVVARLDLGWPEQRLGAEYDGAVHREPRQHSRDLARHNRIRASGWVVLQVDAAMLRRPGELVAQVHGLLSRGGADLVAEPALAVRRARSWRARASP